jgi:hypothetical protein
VVIVLVIIAALVIGISVAYQLGRSSSKPNAAATPSASSAPAQPSSAPTSQSSAPVTSADSASTGTNFTVAQIKSKLATLKTVDSVDNTGYERSLYGTAWKDVDHNGCDTRNDILTRDLTDVTVDSDGCRVESGTLADPYTGKTIHFTRGQGTSLAVQIDHMVPLSRAWGLGASGWSQEEREAFANDPANLLAADGPANNNKSDQGMDEWTPATYSCIMDEKADGDSSSTAKSTCLDEGSSVPNVNIYDGHYYSAFDCEYASRYVIVSDKYKLEVTTGDVTRIDAALATCK